MNYKNKYYKYKLKYLIAKKNLVGGTNSQNEAQEDPQQNQEDPQQNQEVPDSDLEEDVPIHDPIPEQGEEEGHVSESDSDNPGNMLPDPPPPKLPRDTPPKRRKKN